MVYNEVLYRPATLTERLQKKFGERAVTAVYRAVPGEYTASAENNKTNSKNQTGEVLSFFGRVDDTRAADRAMPNNRIARARAAKAVPQTKLASQAKPTQARPAQARPAQARPTMQARPTTKASAEITGTFARAYAVGERTRVQTARAAAASKPKRQYAKGAVPAGTLRRGRSNIPGSRHAVVKGYETETKRTAAEAIRSAFSDHHVAEHRVKRSPFPIGFVTLIGICAFMVMVLLFSFSQINEYNNNIGDLKSAKSELDARASKLEVQLEKRDDIREIEKIAIEDIGMVSSDMVQSKFVSVSGSDRVEVVRAEEEEKEGGVSALLSVIGETLGKLGEYFG